MAAVIEFVPRDDRGSEILDLLESEAGVLPYKSHEQGARTYNLDSAVAGTDGFDAILGRIAPDWREHLSRTE